MKLLMATRLISENKLADATFSSRKFWCAKMLLSLFSLISTLRPSTIGFSMATKVTQRFLYYLKFKHRQTQKLYLSPATDRN